MKKYNPAMSICKVPFASNKIFCYWRTLWILCGSWVAFIFRVIVKTHSIFRPQYLQSGDAINVQYN